jgi:hypothetical protein
MRGSPEEGHSHDQSLLHRTLPYYSDPGHSVLFSAPGNRPRAVRPRVDKPQLCVTSCPSPIGYSGQVSRNREHEAKLSSALANFLSHSSCSLTVHRWVGIGWVCDMCILNHTPFGIIRGKHGEMGLRSRAPQPRLVRRLVGMGFISPTPPLVRVFVFLVGFALLNRPEP